MVECQVVPRDSAYRPPFGGEPTLERVQRQVVAAHERDVSHGCNPSPTVAGGVAEGRQLFEIPVPGIEARFHEQGAPGRGVERFARIEQHPR